MRLGDFSKAGHWPTLLSAFLYFDISFMIWVIVGATSVFIAQDFNLTPAQQGLMVGIPVLGGALLRIPMGLMADKYGGKRVALVGMVLTMLPLVWGLFFGKSINEVYGFGILLGIAGASFAVALPLASRWYPPEHQGLAMGIAGAGNSGTVLAMLFGPRLAEVFGWHNVFGMALIPLGITFIIFAILAKDSPNKPEPKGIGEYLTVLKFTDSWLFCFFYSLSFGGFVGLTSYLNLFFVEQYGVAKVTAGNFVTLCVFAGSFVRPIGGYLSDIIGGTKMLVVLFGIITVVIAAVGTLPSVYAALALLFLTLAALGMANGALFQVIPTRYPKEVGILTGLVGAAGGIGGFFIPNILGTFKGWTDSYAYGFWFIALITLIATIILIGLQKKWRTLL